MPDTIRVLLLEDDPDDARLVALMLRRVTAPLFQVVNVKRLAEAVERIAQGGVDVVLADMTVPDSTGMETVRALIDAAPGLPLVVLTGNSDEELALEALKNGAQDYLVKGTGDGTVLSRVIRYARERKAAEQELKVALERAEQAARAKSVFLAMIGHEVRTPLNGILGMARLLAESRLDAADRTRVAMIENSGSALLGLVNDILDFSRLEAGRMSVERVPFDPGELVYDLVRLLEPRAQEKGIGLAARVADCARTTVAGDPLRVRQILFNLMGNAIKFTETGGVTVSAMLREDDGEGRVVLSLSVADTGIGISDETRQLLFSEFYQADSSIARRYGGTGLGLAICKQLVELMGGSIAVDSVPGRGAEFRVELPTERAAPVAIVVAAPEAEALTAPLAQLCRRVLLVDDNDVNLAVAAGLLERHGHTVVTASDGPSAVAAAGGGGFDLVLLDMRMPGMDGLDTARAIRALPGAAGTVPIHLLTANPMDEDRAAWRAAGIDGCLAKPFRVDELNRLVDRCAPALPPHLPVSVAAPAAEPAGVLNLGGLGDDVALLGRDRVGGLVALMRESSRADLDAVLDHVRAGRIEEVAAPVHRLAGAAASIHLAALSEACRRVENAARKGDAAAAAEISETLPQLWEQGLAELSRVLAG